MPIPRIKCRQCGEPGHLSIFCPQRSPDERAKPWRQQVEEFKAAEDAKPFHCTVPLHAGKEATVHADSVEEFWREIRNAHDFSLYRDFQGIMKEGSRVLVIPDCPTVDSGNYNFVSRTVGLKFNDLCVLLDEGVGALKDRRPLSPDTVKRVQSELLLAFNHFSLSHEGNELDLDETRMLVSLLEGKDSKRISEDKELSDKIDLIPGSKHDVDEAVNHILVSNMLKKWPKVTSPKLLFSSFIPWS